MPRLNADIKYNYNLHPNAFYVNEDPFMIEDDPDEINKYNNIYYLITNKIGKRFKRIIDVGCGEGYFFKWLHRLDYDELWGMDISFHVIRRAADKFSIREIIHDITDKQIPLIGQFNLVICNEVLYYLKPLELYNASCNITKLVNVGDYLVITVSQYTTLDDIMRLFYRFKLIYAEMVPFKNDYQLTWIGQKI